MQKNSNASNKHLNIDISDNLELIPNIEKHSREAATLSVTYWPDRTVPDAYAKLVIQEANK